MGRRLAVHVHVEGVAYGPGDEVSDPVAEKITAPGVWADQSSEPAPQGAGAGVIPAGEGPAVGRPAAKATKDAWVAYAVAQGMPAQDAAKLTIAELAAAFPADG